jgi:hypothetical protein
MDKEKLWDKWEHWTYKWLPFHPETMEPRPVYFLRIVFLLMVASVAHRIYSGSMKGWEFVPIVLGIAIVYYMKDEPTWREVLWRMTVCTVLLTIIWIF